MGADGFVAFVGVKIPIDPDDEDALDAWGEESHPDAAAAVAAGLEVWTGRFTDGEDHYAMVGRLIGHFGLEGASYRPVPPEEIGRRAVEIGPILARLGYRDPPVLHLQFEAQY
jgi:hypothetical protein